MQFSTKSLLAVVAVLARATAEATSVSTDGGLALRAVSCEGGCPEGMVCDSHSILGFPEVLSPGCVAANIKRQDACGGCRDGWECDDYNIGLSRPMCVPGRAKRQMDVAREMRQLRSTTSRLSERQVEDVADTQQGDLCGGCPAGQTCNTYWRPSPPTVGIPYLENRCGPPGESQVPVKRESADFTDCSNCPEGYSCPSVAGGIIGLFICEPLGA